MSRSLSFRRRWQGSHGATAWPRPWMNPIRGARPPARGTRTSRHLASDPGTTASASAGQQCQRPEPPRRGAGLGRGRV